MTNPESLTSEGGEKHETLKMSDQRIYVASLADYNNGRLHGVWLDANQDASELHDQVQAMLEQSQQAVAEEWAIHDYEGYGSLRLNEYETLETIAKIAGGIAAHGPAFAEWIAGLDSSSEADMGRFEGSYLGSWQTVADYADHVLTDLGYDDELAKVIPASLRPYVKIDSAGFGRDLVLSGDIWTAKAADGALYVFTTNA